MSDVLSGSTHSCRSCALSKRMQRETQDPSWAIRQTAMCARASEAARRKSEAAAAALGMDPRAHRALSQRLQSAKSRCSPEGGLPDYAGRGIEFRFDSTASAVQWVVANLGLPAEGQSIDRIDNDGHYEPSNLRWADRTTQNNNKRQYKRTESGERIRALQAAGALYSYESLRTFIKDGLTDEAILSKRKHKHAHPRV